MQPAPLALNFVGAAGVRIEEGINNEEEKSGSQ
jgi:hypothetical protein